MRRLRHRSPASRSCSRITRSCSGRFEAWRWACWRGSSCSLWTLRCVHVRNGDTQPSRDRAVVDHRRTSGFLTRNDSRSCSRSSWRCAIRARRRQHALAAFAPFALCVLVQFAFRYGYYHELAPNTYVAENDRRQPVRRLSRGLDAFAEALAPLAWLSAIGSRGRDLARDAASTTAASAHRPVIDRGAVGISRVGRRRRVGLRSFESVHCDGRVPVLLASGSWPRRRCACASSIARRLHWCSSLLNVVFVETLLLFPVFDPGIEPDDAGGLGGRRRVRGGSRRHRRADRRRVGGLLATTGRSSSRAIPSATAGPRWAVHNGIYVPNDIGVAQFGLALRDAVPPDDRSPRAGSARRPTSPVFEAIDIFGKTGQAHRADQN